MKTELDSLLIDIKAATRIGHAESLWVALDSLFDLPQVAGNPPMQAAFIRQAILPIGEALATPRVASQMLRPLAKHDHAAMRAIAAAAYANRYFLDEQFEANDLAALGRDPRKDVRQALAFALGQAGKGHPDRLAALLKGWIEDDSPRLNALALQLLPSLAEEDPGESMALLSGFQPTGDPGVRTSLVDCLVELAQGEHAVEVLSLLERWASEQGNNLWVIRKTLSHSWVVAYVDRGLEIIANLAKQHGPEKAILKTLKAMRLHGAEEAITQAVERWKHDTHPNLAALAKSLTE
jgi:hypothetical protein